MVPPPITSCLRWSRIGIGASRGCEKAGAPCHVRPPPITHFRLVAPPVWHVRKIDVVEHEIPISPAAVAVAAAVERLTRVLVFSTPVLQDLAVLDHLEQK